MQMQKNSQLKPNYDEEEEEGESDEEESSPKQSMNKNNGQAKPNVKPNIVKAAPNNGNMKKKTESDEESEEEDESDEEEDFSDEDESPNVDSGSFGLLGRIVVVEHLHSANETIRPR